MSRRRLAILWLAALVPVAAGCGGGSSSWRILFLSDRGGDWALYAMDASGEHVQRVLRAGNVDPGGAGDGLGEPVVSPDGRHVLLSEHGVAMGTLATGAVRHLGAGEEASAGWSPDGTRVAFSGYQQEGLEIVDVRSRRNRTLFADSQIWSPTWSPDGSWIAFGRQIGYGPVTTWAVHPDGTGRRELSNYTPRSGNFAWSRGDELAFIGTLGSEEWSRLVVVDPRTQQARVLQSGLGDGTVAWSPDGGTLAYAAAQGTDFSTISTVRADGSGRRRLTPRWPPVDDSAPVWSPYGKSLVFVRAPLGSGAAAAVPEVWSMSADGTQRRALTTAFPDGAQNLEPSWVSGDMHLDAPPEPQTTRRGDDVVLRVPFAVGGIAADAGLAAVGPVGFEQQSDIKPTPPILLWRPGQRSPKRIVASPCGGVDQLVLTGNRLAFDCNHQYFDESAQAVWVADLKSRIPREVFYGESVSFGEGGPGPRGTFLDSIVGGGGLVTFSSEIDRAKTRRRTLWRVDGLLGLAVRSDAQTGNVLATGGGRLAVALPGGRVAITTADGKPIRGLPARVGPFEHALMTGRTLLLLRHRDLVAYDTTTGRPAWRRRLPSGARLESANSRVTAYTVGSSIHLLSRTGEKVIRTGAQTLPVSAASSTASSMQR